MKHIHSRLSRLFTLLFLVMLGYCAPINVHGQTRRHAMRADVRRKPRVMHKPDVIYVPTPPETVDVMLKLANLKPDDIVYDLGSGDGRIPLAAAQQYGVRAVGIEIDKRLVDSANERARELGLQDRVQFRVADIYRTDFHQATVVMLYLSDTLNVKLLPQLLRQLRPGARIISHDFRMGAWQPEQTVRVPWKNLYRTVYVWTVPPDGALKRRLLRGARARH